MSKQIIELLAKDLNHNGGVYCPNPAADMKLWNSHPKVPYCGTVYRLKAGETVGHAH
jgi:hypothetical protein